MLGSLGGLGGPTSDFQVRMSSFGAGASASIESFRAALQQALSGSLLDESRVGEIIVNVMPRDDQVQSLWNLDVVAEVLSQECRQLNWTAVVQRLDQPNLVIRSEADFRLLIKLFTRISNTIFPGLGLMGVWNNRSAQLVLLLLASNATQRGLVDFASMLRAEQTLPDVQAPQNIAWCCLPFYSTLLELAARGHYNEVLQTMLEAAEAYPEYVTVMLAQSSDGGSNVRAEVLRRSLPKFTGLAGSRNTSLVVMKRLQAVNPDLLVLLFRMAFKRCMTVQDIIDRNALAQSSGQAIFRRVEEEGLLDEMLGLWCVQADRAGLALEEKLSAVLQANPTSARSILVFVRQHVGTVRSREQDGGLLSFENFAVLIRAMQAYSAVVPIDDVRALVAVFQQLQQQATAGRGGSLIGGLNLGQGGQQNSSARIGKATQSRLVPGASALPTTVPGLPDEMAVALNETFTDDVESESSGMLQRLFHNEINLNDLLPVLRRLKMSNDQHEQEVFRCIIHNIFDEYRFLATFPDKELQLSSVLFGSLVNNQLVSSITLGISLRYVLEGLRKDPELNVMCERMFRFGKVALEQFRSRLGEWPQYCSHLLQVPHFQRHAPQLFDEINRALNGQSPPTSSSAAATVTASSVLSGLGDFPSLSTSLQRMNSAPAGSGGGGGGGGASLSQQVAGMSLQSLDRTSSLDGGLSAYSSSQGGGGSVVGGGPFTSLGLLSGLGGVGTNGTASGGGGGSGPSQPSAAEIEAQRQASPRNNKPSAIDDMAKVNIEAVNPAQPPEGMRDKIAFIVNNIAQNNYEAQAHKLREMLQLDFYVWFANYLVTKRISQQPNLHPLYLGVLEAFDSPQLFKDILDSTYYNVTKLLQSPNITSSSSERSLLRNLGIWLGQVTLARNKPILQRRINLKELLFWGYETGRLIAVCSFVAKTVEGVRDSKVFRPPNPWLMALLGVMRDLYEVEELKMNIKFEVQVLCKNVNIRIEDIPRANKLGTLRMPNKGPGNPDFTVKTGSVAPASSSALSSLPAGVAAGFPSLSGIKTDEDLSKGPSLSEQPVIPQLAQFVVVNPALGFFASNPGHRRLVSLAVDRAIREIIQPVVDRSAQVACVSSKQVVLKDFVNEGNEQYLRSAAHLMVSQLAGSLAVVTCKEPLRVSIVSNLRSLLAQINVTDPGTVEQILQVCSNDNLELGCALIEKAAMEKAVRDLDESLQASYQARRKARETGQTFVDTAIVRQASGKFPKELPDALKSRATGLLPHQLLVYEGFSQRLRLQPAGGGGGDAAINAGGAGAGQDGKNPGAVMLSMQHALEAYQIILQRIDMALKAVHLQAQGRDISISMLPGDHEILSLLRDMIIVTQRTQLNVRVEATVSFAEIIFKRLVENIAVPDVLRLEVLVGSLEALRDACGGQKKFAPDMMAWLTRYGAFNINDEVSRKMHRAILLLLLRAKLIRSSDVDTYLATSMDSGRNMIWVELALGFVRQCLADGIAATQEFANTFDTVSKMRPANAAVRKQLQRWLTELRALSTSKDEVKMAGAAGAGVPGAPGGVGGGPASMRDSSVREHVTVLLERWLRMWQAPMNDQVFAQYLHLMHQYGVLKTEEAADRFFRVATELCVEACLKTAQPVEGNASATTLTFTVMDALSKLLLLLVRLADKESGDLAARVNLLSRILNAVVRTLIEDHENKKAKREVFDQRPFFRLLHNLAQDLGLPDMSQDPSPAVIALIVTYSHAYTMLVPTVVPGFAFSWLQLISQRCFMPQLLLIKGQKGWPYMHRLLMALLLFLQPFLKTVQLTDAVRKMYKGTLRVLLVVLHDFPEFLAEYHMSFCDVIPSTCVQLRNLVLSAFPKSMRLPDPFTPNLKIEMIPDINLAPRISSDSLNVLSNIRQRLDLFLQSRQPAEFPSLLPQVLVQAGVYNAPLLNALVVYLGAQGVLHMQASSPVPIESTPSMDIFKHLTTALDAEGRYLLVSAMANQLRYPNSHTRYFSTVVLLLFAEAESEYFQEQITRVLLERLIVHRPHPWGLLITFIELLKNPRYAFWRRNFTRGVPEIERVFETVARSLSGSASSGSAADGGSSAEAVTA